VGTFLLGALGAFIGGLISILTSFVTRAHEEKLELKRYEREMRQLRLTELAEAVSDVDRLYWQIERLLPDENVLSKDANNPEDRKQIDASYYKVGDRLSQVEIYGGGAIAELYEEMYASCRGIVSVLEYERYDRAADFSEKFRSSRSKYISCVRDLGLVGASN